jgi:hypothetical protein
MEVNSNEIKVCVECGIPGEEFFEDEIVCQDCKYETCQEKVERIQKYFRARKLI